MNDAAVDRLAVLAALVAVAAIPALGIGHPLAHALVIATIAVYGWLLARPASSLGPVARWLDLGWPAGGSGWAWVLAGGVGSALLKWWLDGQVLHGRGGIAFYRALLAEQGILPGGGTVRWDLLTLSAPVLFLVILLDGVFFSGLIQKRLARQTGLHAAVHAQAVLFALPHTFAGPVPDPVYGCFTYLAGVAYGYVYAAAGSHWMPATLLWTHVMAVWVILAIA